MKAGKYEAFVNAVKLESFSKAGEKLGYSQSAVSHMIRALEEELGAALLIRDRSGVRLTDEGRALFPHIQNICNSHRELHDMANTIHGLESGIVRIGTVSSISCHILPAVIKLFHSEHPNIEFEIEHGHYTEIESWVLDGTVDIGILRITDNPEFNTIPLLTDKLLVIMPNGHPIAGLESFPVGHLEKEAFILLNEGDDKDNEIQHIFETCNITPRMFMEIRDDYTIMSMVECGLGISILPELVLKRTPYEIVMKELECPAYRRLGIITRKNRQCSAAVKEFVKIAVERFSNG